MSKKRKADKARIIEKRSAPTDRLRQMLAHKNINTVDDLNQFIEQYELMENLNVNDGQPKTAAEQARDEVLRATLEKSNKRKLQLIAKALELDPDCIEAYLLKAQESSGQDEIANYRAAVEIGRRRFAERLEARTKPKAVSNSESSTKSNPPSKTDSNSESNAASRTDSTTESFFWTDKTTRPFMKALDELAWALYTARRSDEALAIWRELLELNPNDDQNIKLYLAPALVDSGLLEEAEALFKRFENNRTAHFLYSRALALFKREGATALASQALYAALAKNQLVLEVMSGRKPVPARSPEIFQLGSLEEAQSYLAIAMRTWLDHPESLTWFREVIKQAVERSKLSKTFPGLKLSSAKAKPNYLKPN